MPATALSRSQVPVSLAANGPGRSVSLAEFLLLLGDTRLPTSCALYILGSIARTLTDSHARGMVHGRLEPSLVSLAVDGSVSVAFPRPGARLVPAYAAPELKSDERPDV